MIYKSFLLEQNINNLKDNITLFYGENDGLKKDLQKKIKSNLPNSEKIIYFQDDILKKPDSFYNEIVNASLFEKEKIYFIYQTNDKILDLIKLLEGKDINKKIFLFAELLDKKSKLRSYFEKTKSLGVVACYNDNETIIKKIIIAKLSKYEGLSTENINIIIENSNLDRIKLNNELDKIQTYFKDKKIIRSQLLSLLNLNENDNFDFLRDAALCGRNIITNKLLNFTFIENDKTIFYLNNINQRLNKLNEILLINNKPVEQSINEIKPPIFWKDKPTIVEQTKKWNLEKIQLVLKKTFDFEIKIKTNSTVDKNVILKKLIVEICNIANA